MHSVVVHAHFYQPPRENPWRDEVEEEPTAAPFHDWNERVTHECYRPFATARLRDAAGRVQGHVNLFEWASFDAATTLLRWLEPNAPEVYRAILDGDRASVRRLRGHGNAIAMPYHHVILPLASRRDKVTEVRWGLADFRRRFGRGAEGLWLPETAVDEETLVVMAEEGVRFTVLAPHQVEPPPSGGAPLRFVAGGGRELAIFAYDGTLSPGVAFGRLVEDGAELARHLAPPILDETASRDAFTLTTLAMDGETFGHHRKFAEMALARAVALLLARPAVRIENFAAVLARAPALVDARIVEGSSWSCPHGVERWRADCGCRATPGTSQAWRRPLRAALNWLARELDHRFESEGATFFPDPWRVRDAFGAVAALPRAARHAFAAARVRDGTDAERATRLLDGVSARLGMFGSCAWFFDDVAGHETVLMLRLAAYALELLGDDALERGLLDRLAVAPANDAGAGDGAQVYRSRAHRSRAGTAA